MINVLLYMKIWEINLILNIHNHQVSIDIQTYLIYCYSAGRQLEYP